MTQSQDVRARSTPLLSGARWVLVLLAGLATTVATLLIAWAIEYFSNGRFTIMGLYFCGIVPGGAILVGIGAASGYAGVALVGGVRVRAPLLLCILGITVMAYIAMHDIEYAAQGPMVHRDTGVAVSFFEYFDMKTRELRFVVGNPNLSRPNDDDHSVGLGAMGYAARVLELGAFSLGSLCLPLALRGRRYCDSCRSYHQNYRLAVIPACVKSKKFVGNSGDAEIEAQHTAAAEQAEAAVAQFADAVCTDDPAIVARFLERFQPGSKQATKRQRRVELRLSRCPFCGHGVVFPRLITLRGRNNFVKKELWSAPVDPAFSDALRPR